MILKCLSPRRCCSSAVAAFLMTLFLSSATGTAQTPDDTPAETTATLPLWTLQPRQSFRAEIATRRVSELLIENEYRESDVTDHVTLEYQVRRRGLNGVTQIDVRILDLHRIAPSQSTAGPAPESIPVSRLSRLKLILQINSSGTGIEVGGQEQLYRHAPAGLQPLLQQLVRSDVLRFWIAAPFDIPLQQGDETGHPPSPPLLLPLSDSPPASDSTPPPRTLHAGLTWPRSQVISLGVLGQLACQCRYQITSINSRTANLEMQGTPVPIPVSNDVKTPVLFRPEDLKLNVAELAGNGTLTMGPDTALPKRLELQQTLKLAGDVHIRSGAAPHQIRFKQTLTRTVVASEFVQPVFNSPRR